MSTTDTPLLDNYSEALHASPPDIIDAEVFIRQMSKFRPQLLEILKL